MKTKGIIFTDEDPETFGCQGFVEYIMIDTQEALSLFAATLREHGLA